MKLGSYMYLVAGVALITVGGFLFNELDPSGVVLVVCGVFCLAVGVLREK